ncbi:MAG: HU family DNA-binding protein [Bacteroidales bacterium]|nr:HU family DNA-binding protein [Bacteroidales bacterium]
MRRYYSITKKTFVDKTGVEQTKFYPNSVAVGLYTTEDMARDISEASSFTEADMIGALRGMSDIIITKLKLGYNVKLDGVGIFSLSLTSEGFNSAEECKPNRIKVRKITFKADRKLKKEMIGLKFYKAELKNKR